MFDACEGCGGIPDHRIDGPKCVANRAEAVRDAQARLDANTGGYESEADLADLTVPSIGDMID